MWPKSLPLQGFMPQPLRFNFCSKELANCSKMYQEYVNYSNFKMSDNSHVSIQISSINIERYKVVENREIGKNLLRQNNKTYSEQM